MEEYKKNGIENVIIGYEIKDKEDVKVFKRKNLFFYSGLNIFYLAIVKKIDYKIISDLFYSKKLYNDLVIINSGDLEDNKKVSSLYFHNGFLNLGKNPNKFPVSDTSYTILKKIKNNNQALFYSINHLKNNFELYKSWKFIIKISQKRDIPIILGSFSRKKQEVPKKIELYSFKKLLGIKYSSKLVYYKFIIDQINRIRLSKNPFYFAKGYYIAKFPFEDCREF